MRKSRSLDAELNTSRAVERLPHFHRLVVRCDLSFVLNLIALQVFAHGTGVDSAIVNAFEVRIGVENEEQES